MLVLVFWEKLGNAVGSLPKDPHQAARRVLESSPIIVSIQGVFTTCIGIVHNTRVAL